VNQGELFPAVPGTDEPAAPPPTAEHVPWDRVEVVRSKRRRRTVASEIRDGALVLWVPSWMSQADVDGWVSTMGRRHLRRRSVERVDLDARARRLARAHDLPRPASIEWSDRMQRRWGSCSPADRTIRISSVLAGFPDWVLDYVIVHELAHLVVAGHGDDFWQLVARYPRSERAIGFLMAKSDGSSDEWSPSHGDGAADAHDAG
jgi:predicted metal-dependent hydrolase